MKCCIGIVAILLSSSIAAEAPEHDVSNRDIAMGREDSGFSDEYKLYDRNQAGLDWNRYSFPSSAPRQQPPINR